MADKIDRKIRGVVEAITKPKTTRKRVTEDARTRIVARKVTKLVQGEHRRKARNA